MGFGCAVQEQLPHHGQRGRRLPLPDLVPDIANYSFTIVAHKTFATRLGHTTAPAHSINAGS
jgi:hypothetical protein